MPISPMPKVAGAVRDFPVDDIRVGTQVVVYAHVDELQFESVLAAEHVHAAAPVAEIDHLLPRDFAGRHAHPFLLDAVVGSEKQVAGMVERRAECLLDEADLQGKFFQPPHGAFGLVQVVYFFLLGGAKGFVWRGYMKCFHVVYLIFTGIPLTIR